MRWPDFPDVTDENEPEIPDTDACQSELNVAGVRPTERASHTLNEGF